MSIDTGNQISRSHVEYTKDVKLIVTIFQCGCQGIGGKYIVLYKPCNRHTEPQLEYPLGQQIPPEGVWINVPIQPVDEFQKEKEFEAINERMKKAG